MLSVNPSTAKLNKTKGFSDSEGGFGRTPLLKSSIHMNLYVGHTHLIENSTHFRKKELPCV